MASTMTNAATRHVLVIDDEADIRRMLTRALESEGYRVRAHGDPQAALQDLASERIDLVLLDLTLGSDDGIDLLATIRRNRDVPVIVLTGRGHEADRILGLRFGADDYVVKPFSLGELIARIETVLRRAAPLGGGGEVSFGDLRINRMERVVRVSDREVELTAKEFDLLAFLASAPRQVLSREQLLRQVWDSSVEWQDAATVTEHVRRIRRKIEENPNNPRWITTVRGVGYRFEP